MKGVLVDSNVILDLFLDDPIWAVWSESVLEKQGRLSRLLINPIIYSEISIAFKRIEELEDAIRKGGFEMLEIPREALFLAGKAFLKYRRKSGNKSSPLPDFFIGAQAAIFNLKLITRDLKRFPTYFPTVKLITPTLP